MVLDIELLTPTPGQNAPELTVPRPAPLHARPARQTCAPALFPPTLAMIQARGACTPRVMGPTRTTFRSPTLPTPMTPSEPRNFLRSLNLVAMEPPPPPHPPPCMHGAVPDSGNRYGVNVPLPYQELQACCPRR